MLVIRESQMRAFERAAERDFELRMRRRLEGVLDARRWPPSAIEAQVRRGLARCRDYGFPRTEGLIAEYVETVCLHLGGFGRAPHPPEAMLILFGPGNDADRIHEFRMWAESRQSRVSHVSTI